MRAGLAVRVLGATLTPEDIAELLRTEPRAIGLAEMMDYPAVVAGDDDAVAKVGRPAIVTSTVTHQGCRAAR